MVAIINISRSAQKINQNRRMILDLLRFSPEGISQAELARKMMLTRAAVSSIISDLKSMNFIEELKIGAATGGRRPVLLSINPNYGFVLGIDMGATHLGIVITDFSGHVLDETEQLFSISDGPEVCLRQVNHHLNELLFRQKLKLDQISSIGISVPGPVMYGVGMVSSPPIMPGWDKFPIRDHLQDMWHVPIFIGNDAEMGAVGEWIYGAGRGENYIAYIKVGTGVGAGFIFDGQIYRGKTGFAGEIGHITIQDNGPKCNCGNYGCLEAVVGGRAIARKASEAIKKGQRTELSAIATNKIHAIDVAQAAQRGDLVAQQIISEAGMYLGIAIANLVNIINPGIIIIGGGISQIGDLLLEPIRKAVMEKSLQSALKDVRISSAVLGKRASSLGAVVQAINLSLDRL